MYEPLPQMNWIFIFAIPCNAKQCITYFLLQPMDFQRPPQLPINWFQHETPPDRNLPPLRQDFMLTPPHFHPNQNIPKKSDLASFKQSFQLMGSSMSGLLIGIWGRCTLCIRILCICYIFMFMDKICLTKQHLTSNMVFVECF